MKGLDREILRLALPSILANLTIPLVGLVDTAVAGHMGGNAGAAAFLGAISVGGLMFSLLYWNFGFLRTGTGGLTAQAYGRSKIQSVAGKSECGRILIRGVRLALIIAAVVLILQWPFAKLAMLLIDSSGQVSSLALQYFFIRVWAAPATLSLMAFRGWFIGMQDSRSSMWTDLVVNGVNIAASIILGLGTGRWQGLGFAGIAWGTVIAQYSGLAYALLTCRSRYGKVFKGLKLSGDPGGKGELKAYFALNAELFVRSLCMTAIYVGFTALAARLGDLMLACSGIMMNLLMVFSYFTDGFAYAGEALTGRFIGEGDRDMLSREIKAVFRWSMAVALLWVGIYMAAGTPLLHLMTSDPMVVDSCRKFLPWLILMPPIGCAAFTWDGIYIGATAAKGIRDAMICALAAFFGVWLAGRLLLNPSGELGLHLLLGAYFAHLLARTVRLSVHYRRYISINQEISTFVRHEQKRKEIFQK